MGKRSTCGMPNLRALAFAFALVFSLLMTSCSAGASGSENDAVETARQEKPAVTLPDLSIGDSSDDADETASSDEADSFAVPSYSGSPYESVGDGRADFTQEELARSSFEDYSPLDDLGRCGVAFALIGVDTMPTEERDSIGGVRPSGWHLARYDWVDGKYLYNRCHLIGYQLAGENANERNLITGTRSMNVEGMLPFENEVADYVERTGNHVLYRVTPVFEGKNLVATGVRIEARSVEDGGSGVDFDVFCFNVEPGVRIDYSTGASEADGTMAEADLVDEDQYAYILNTNTSKFHYSSCPSVSDMDEKNKQGFDGTREEAVAKGYSPCGRCKP